MKLEFGIVDWLGSLSVGIKGCKAMLDKSDYELVSISILRAESSLAIPPC